jgi:hypothetical protein
LEIIETLFKEFFNFQVSNKWINRRYSRYGDFKKLMLVEEMVIMIQTYLELKMFLRKNLHFLSKKDLKYLY